MFPPPNPAPPPAAQPRRQLQLELPAALTAIYSNGAVISQTHSEIILDFVQIMPNDPRARVQTRIVMTPANAKALLQALTTNLSRFEQINGEIKLPPPSAPSLADHLFGNLRPPESPDGDKPAEPGTE